MRTVDMNDQNISPDEEPLDDDEEMTGAVTDPLADTPGSRGHKAFDPYQDTEATDTPGPSPAELIEDTTPANDEELGGGEEL